MDDTKYYAPGTRETGMPYSQKPIGKGSIPRPIPNPDAYRKNWDTIFGKKK